MARHKEHGQSVSYASQLIQMVEDEKKRFDINQSSKAVKARRGTCLKDMAVEEVKVEEVK